MKNLETVILPDTLEKIGREAFAGCEKLETVVLGEKSALEEIGNRAFYRCKKLDAGFVPEQVTVAEDAFEGAKETESPTKEPEETTPTPVPEDLKPPEAEPEMPTPVPEDHKPPEAEPEMPTPDPEDEPNPGYWGGGGGGGGGGFSMSRVSHQRYTGRVTADYDALNLTNLKDEAEKIMERLTLGGESLELTLAGEDGGESAFTVNGMDWTEPGGETVDTLILTAEEDARNTWRMNGEVLRRMHRSGVNHLVLRCGDRIAVMETEGFLAGWAYDAMKSRGTANRRFEYEIGMDGENPAAWRVTVEGQRYELTEDEHAGIYLTGVYSGPAEALDNPYEAWLEEERRVP
jgi:hypothetical protein